VGRLHRQDQDTLVFPVSELVVFDRQQFESSTMYDLSLQREILGMFFGQLDQVLVQLGNGPLTPEESKFMAHTLRGAAAALGALEVQKLTSDWAMQIKDQAGLRLKLVDAKSHYQQAVTRYLPAAGLN
jgi:HPt (histidine-containing phosphotransfer) domain-containing protein